MSVDIYIRYTVLFGNPRDSHFAPKKLLYIYITHIIIIITLKIEKFE